MRASSPTTSSSDVAAMPVAAWLQRTNVRPGDTAVNVLDPA
jgi:hypothetical protein